MGGFTLSLSLVSAGLMFVSVSYIIQFSYRTTTSLIVSNMKVGAIGEKRKRTA